MHLLFFDLVALNYEPSTPVLTSIYDMKLLDKVLTDPAIALLFLDASKKGSCSIYLHDIHGYGPQIAYRFPNLQHIPLVVPRRDRQYVQDLTIRLFRTLSATSASGRCLQPILFRRHCTEQAWYYSTISDHVRWPILFLPFILPFKEFLIKVQNL